jgi:hypothetical protein
LPSSFKRLGFIVAILWGGMLSSPLSAETASTTTLPAASAPLVPVPDTSSAVELPTPSTRPIRALHVTGWQAGSKKYRAYLDDVFKTTMVNAVAIDIKEYQGEVFIPGVAMAKESGAFIPAIPDLAEWLADLKKRGIYTIARQVVYKDNVFPRKNPKAAVHNHLGEIWYDRGRITWLDPYNQEARRYNLLIALQAAKLGFDEIQFDYIRFPTDGNLKAIRYAQPHTPGAASQALVDFLSQARRLLHPLGIKISIDVFGLTTSVNTGMGIGQQMGPMTAEVDFVCPMTYPSHYNPGEYGLAIPNDQPYKTIYMAMRDALKVLGPENAHKLRPYFQDFSLKGRGIKYGPAEVRAQIQAAADLNVMDWTLWNARCVYTLAALKEPVQPHPGKNTYQISVSTP